MLNWTPQSRNEEKTFAAVPPDVRKGSAFPKHLQLDSGEAKPRTLRRSLSENLTFTGKPEAFRTSGGEAARRSPL